ncbi:MAG: hypothetical protein J5892_00670 [Bacilli bacterium]|nr:hypothetical protein [Bacilli bacterium]
MTNLEMKAKLNEYVTVLDELKGVAQDAEESLKVERVNQIARKKLISNNIALVNSYNNNRAKIRLKNTKKAAIVSMIGILIAIISTIAIKQDVSLMTLSAIPAFPLGIITLSYCYNKKIEDYINSLQADPAMIEKCEETINYCNEHLKNYKEINELIKSAENKISLISDAINKYDNNHEILINTNEVDMSIETIKRLVNTYNGN